MKIRLAIWFLLLSVICAFGLGNNGVPPFFAEGGATDTDSIIDTLTATSGTTFTRSSLDFGSNSTGRVIVVVVGSGSAVTAGITSIVIGGVTATIARSSYTGGITSGGAVYYATPSGTSGQSIVITMSSAVNLFAYTAYRLVTVGSTTPTGGSNSGGTSNATYTFTTAIGGTVFAAGQTTNSNVGGFVYSGPETFATDNSINSASRSSLNGSVVTNNVFIGRTLKFSPTPGTTAMDGAVAQWF